MNCGTQLDKFSDYFAVIVIFVLVLKRVIDTMAEDWSSSRSNEEYAVMIKTAKITRAISVTSTIITNSLFVAYIFFKVL